MRSAKVYAYHSKTWLLIILSGIDMFVILNNSTKSNKVMKIIIIPVTYCGY